MRRPSWFSIIGSLLLPRRSSQLPRSARGHGRRPSKCLDPVIDNHVWLVRNVGASFCPSQLKAKHVFLVNSGRGEKSLQHQHHKWPCSLLCAKHSARGLKHKGRILFSWFRAGAVNSTKTWEGTRWYLFPVSCFCLCGNQM